MLPASPFMQAALAQARAALPAEVPIGAVVVDAGGNIVAAAHNLTETTHDPSAHAEMLALRQAAQKLGNARLTGCDLYVTLEPCPMCAQAISFARIRRVYYGAPDVKGGGVDNGARIYHQPSCHHAPEVISGLCESEAASLLREFFSAKR